MKPGYKDAHGETEAALHSLTGLVLAIYELAADRPEFCNRSADTHAFLAVLNVAMDLGERTTKMHDAEFQAARADKA